MPITTSQFNQYLNTLETARQTGITNVNARLEEPIPATSSIPQVMDAIPNIPKDREMPEEWKYYTSLMTDPTKDTAFLIQAGFNDYINLGFGGGETIYTLYGGENGTTKLYESIVQGSDSWDTRVLDLENHPAPFYLKFSDLQGKPYSDPYTGDIQLFVVTAHRTDGNEWNGYVNDAEAFGILAVTGTVFALNNGNQVYLPVMEFANINSTQSRSSGFYNAYDLKSVYYSNTNSNRGLVLSETYSLKKLEITGNSYSQASPSWQIGLIDNIVLDDVLGNQNLTNNRYLKNVTITSPNITQAGPFSSCISLKTVKNTTGTPMTLVNNNFYLCYSLTTIDCNFSENTTIPTSSFYSTFSLKKFDFPPNLISIGSSAFVNTGLKEAILPSTLESIGSVAFFRASILYFKFNSITAPSLADTGCLQTDIRLPSGSTAETTYFCPYDGATSYLTSTNWVTYASSVRGFGTFDSGVALPTQTTDGNYTLTWYGDGMWQMINRTQSSVITQGTGEEIYCTFTAN